MGDASGEKSHRDIISAHSVFEGLSDDELTALADRCTERQLDVDEKLIERGEFNYFLYLIIDGDAQVELEDGYTASLGAGDIVGEISVSGLSSPIADVIAKTEMHVLAFPIDLIADLTIEHDEFGEKLRAIGSDRMVEDDI